MERLAGRHAGMVLVSDDLAVWLIRLIADTDRKKLTTLAPDSDQSGATAHREAVLGNDANPTSRRSRVSILEASSLTYAFSLGCSDPSLLGAPMDMLTRAAAFLGLGLSAVSIAVTWYLWSRSGPRLKVNTHYWHVGGLDPRLYVEVRNLGRLPAIVHRIECVYEWEGGIPHHVPIRPNSDPLPRGLSPTEYPGIRQSRE